MICIVADLPVSFGFDSVLVVVDHELTKGLIFIPCNKSINAANIATLFLKHIFTHFNLHDKVLSNYDP